MFNRMRKPLATPGTRPRSLAKRVSLREINKARPSDIYNNSRSPYPERAATFHACSPSSGGAKPNLFCYAASEVAHKPGGADLRLASWPSQMLSWHCKCRVVINLPQLPLTFWKLNTGALGERKHENMMRDARFSYHHLQLLDLVLTRSAGSGSGSERAAQFSRR